MEIAKRMEMVLDKKITKDAALLRNYDAHGAPNDRLENIVGKDLERLGFEIDFAKQAPFDIFAKEKTLLISDVETDKRRIQKRVMELQGFIRVVDRPAVIITEKIHKELELPTIERSELEQLESGKELIRFARREKE